MDPTPTGAPAPRRRSVILDVAVRAELHTLLLVSLYLLFAGHNQPGGGFAGGLVASAALCLRYVAAGTSSLDRSLPIAPPVLLGTGLLLAIGAGAVPLLVGDQFMESAIWQVDLPLFGQVKFTSVLVFDAGVYLVVLGMAMMLLEQFGRADGGVGDDEPAGRDVGAGGAA